MGAFWETEAMQHLRPVDRLVVDVALDNLSDNYSSKPHHVSPEFNNVMAAGAKEISGPTLCCAQLTSGQIAPFQKVPAPEELAAHGAQVVNSGAPRFLLEDCFYVSGEIPRVSSFEKGRPDHLCRRAVDQPWEPDPLILDERYVAVNVQGKGLIVFSSCSHAGIVNVLLNAREAFPDVPLYGVLGGLHLAGAAMERLIPDTMAHLQQFALQQIMPAHCTGWRALWALLNTFGESVVTPSAVGSRFTF